jgi:hypothetical protein
MTAPSFSATEQVQSGSSGVRSVVGVLTVPTSGSGGTAISAGSGGTVPHLKGLTRLEMLDPTFSSGHLASFTENDLKVHGKKLAAANVSQSVTDLLPDAKGGLAANQASSGSNPVNGAFVHALAAADTTLRNSGITNPTYARNLVAVIKSVLGGTLPATMGSITFIGTDINGNALTETKSLAALASVVISAGGYVAVVASKAFATLTSYQLTVDLTATVSDAQLSIGLGTKFALRQALATPASGDVKAVQKNTAAAAYTVDTANNLVSFSADLADNDDLYIEYMATGSSAAGLATVEAPASTNLGTVRVRAVGW